MSGKTLSRLTIVTIFTAVAPGFGTAAALGGIALWDGVPWALRKLKETGKGIGDHVRLGDDRELNRLRDQIQTLNKRDEVDRIRRQIRDHGKPIVVPPVKKLTRPEMLDLVTRDFDRMKAWVEEEQRAGRIDSALAQAMIGELEFKHRTRVREIILG